MLQTPPFSRNSLVTAIVASSPVITLASDTGHLTLARPWETNTEVMYYVREGAEHKAGIRSLIPIQQNNNSLSFLDVRLINGEGKVDEGNFALGQRWLHQKNSVIAGWYGGLDVRRSSTGRRFKQLTLGGEILGETYDLIGNYYHPLSDPKFTGASSTGGVFVGNSLYSAGVFEEALEGFDVELGRKLNAGKWNRYEPRVYAKYYHFEGEKFSDKDQGLGLRFTARPRQDLLLELGWEEDKLRGSQVSFTFTYAFGQSDKTAARSLRQRMTEFHQRDIDIRETSQLSEEQRSSEAVEDRVLIANNVIHVDNSAATNGDGSFGNPYNSIANCNTGDCNNANLIYVHAGDADYTTAITLSDGQRLIGQGYNLYGIGGDQAPVITTAGSTVTLASNTEVAGFTLESTTEHGIRGDEVTGNIRIHSNDITAKTNSIFIRNDLSGGTDQTNVTIANNQLTSEREAVQYSSYLEGGIEYSETLLISNNQITSTEVGRGNGIEIQVNAEDANTQVNRQLTIAGNNVDAAQHGIYLELSQARSGAVINEQINISSNTIVSEEHSINLAYAYAEGINSQLQRDIQISNNTLTSNTETGIFADTSEAFDGGELTETMLISNNHIQGEMKGIFLESVYAKGTDSVLTRNLTISQNTILDHHLTGIDLGNNAPDDGGTLNHLVTIENNLIRSDNIGFDDNIGIEYSTEVLDDGTQLNDTFIIRNNTIESVGRAIELNIYADGGAITSDYQITNNTITSDGEAGLYIVNRTNDLAPTSSTSFNANITGNTINAVDDAIELRNEANGLAASMEAIIRNNSLNSDSDGIEMHSDNTDQTVTASGNSFSVNNEAVNNQGNGSCSGEDCP